MSRTNNLRYNIFFSYRGAKFKLNLCIFKKKKYLNIMYVKMLLQWQHGRSLTYDL